MCQYIPASVFAAAFGFAYGVGAVASPLVAELFGLISHGTILATINLGFNIGSAAGPSVAGYIFDTTGSYQVVFLVCAVLCITSVILSFLLRPIPRKGLV